MIGSIIVLFSTLQISRIWCLEWDEFEDNHYEILSKAYKELGSSNNRSFSDEFKEVILNTGFEFNIDGESEYYGNAINSNIELRWQRRSYDVGIFYNPYRGVGGVSFHLNDFNFSGIGLPFVPYNPLPIN